MLDIDDYDHKHGWRTFSDHIDRHGPLPRTWSITSRPGTRSRQLLFRVDLRGPIWGVLAGGDVDVLHETLRYCVLPGSVHPDGRAYRLYDASGAPTMSVPRVEQLPVLPAAWRPALSKSSPALGRRKVPPAGGSAHNLPAAQWQPSDDDRHFAALAQALIESGEAPRLTAAAGLSPDALGKRLGGIPATKATRLQAGHLAHPRVSLLARYGRLLAALKR